MAMIINNPSWYFSFILALILLSVQTNLAENEIKCIESEREALLSFKYGLVDRGNVLSSWRSEDNSDCCNWAGVRCCNITKHIISLDLRGPHDYNNMLEGKIGSSLVNLSHLIHLDLSDNYFHHIFEDIGSLFNLRYLNLSYNLLEDFIPPQMGNLSKLTTLDLQQNNLFNDAYDSLAWVSNLSSLEHLFLSDQGFSGAKNWANIISKLTLLESLFLDGCNLPQPMLSSHSSTNSSRFLSKLNLGGNNLNASIFSWLLNFRSSSLVYLDLSNNNLQGLTIDDFRHMTTSLEFLDLSSTNLDFRSSKSFGLHCNLKTLYLSDNNIGGLLSEFLKNFPQCVLDSLQYLKLSSNGFFGPLPNFATMLSSLRELNLFTNTLNGTIPQSVGQLSNLKYLYLNNNSLEGKIYEAHFSKLTNLRGLDLSENNLILNFKSVWIPPFQLESISLRSCNLGPSFPKWLQTQNFSLLDISNTSISDVIPHWFWNNLSPNLVFMDLSGNKIKGEIPNLSLKFRPTAINLRSNEFFGDIPAFLLQAMILNLSNNTFSSVTGLCEVKNSPLEALDLSNNQLSGQLPNCWYNMPQLILLNLGDNNFSGAIPSSIGSLIQLCILKLRNNQFSGELHYNWFNFTDLEVFDVMHNNLCGVIPSWIGYKSPKLIHLNLKSNHFYGTLPSSLCNLRNIQVLDISSNNITGSIPSCIHNFSVLTQRSNSTTSYFGDVEFIFSDGSFMLTLFSISFSNFVQDDMILVWKGQERIIKGTLVLRERSIDLSCNQLTGKIPNEITELVGLITLNLSSNNLIGQIPDKMGRLGLLESLDLSKNRLCGQIPPSVSQIFSLSVLNLSYNNLSGKIPTGSQLNTFENSSYEGNPLLCGAPLHKCYEDIQDQDMNTIPVEREKEGEFMMREFFMSMSIGFVVGLWGIFGSLVLNRKWRHAYFKFLGKMRLIKLLGDD